MECAMLKHLATSAVICGTLLCSGLSASASPETAEQWGVQASELYESVSQMLVELDHGDFEGLPTRFDDNMARFASTASYLAIWTDETQSAPDLGCIYRGMAEETEIQFIALEEATTAKSIRVALQRIASMTDDAQSIAVASAHAARTGQQAAPTSECLTNDRLIDHALGIGAN